jgi:hypothetical protein
MATAMETATDRYAAVRKSTWVYGPRLKLLVCRRPVHQLKAQEYWGGQHGHLGRAKPFSATAGEANDYKSSAFSRLASPAAAR